LPARQGRVPRSKTVIHKVLGVLVCGLRVLSASVACAGWCIYAFVGTAVQSTAHLCLAPLQPCLHHQPPPRSHLVQSHIVVAVSSFVRTTGGPGSVSGSEVGARTQGACCGLRAQSPNKSFQRTGTHKVLGRGRPSTVRTRALPRPRAERAACRR
jgi:hypothetical protein